MCVQNVPVRDPSASADSGSPSMRRALIGFHVNPPAAPPAVSGRCVHSIEVLFIYSSPAAAALPSVISAGGALVQRHQQMHFTTPPTTSRQPVPLQCGHFRFGYQRTMMSGMPIALLRTFPARLSVVRCAAESIHPWAAVDAHPRLASTLPPHQVSAVALPSRPT